MKSKQSSANCETDSTSKISVKQAQDQAIDQALQRSLQIIYKKPPQNAVEWADENYYLSPESSGVEGRWRTLPYQRAPLLCMTSDDIEVVNWMKSARVGYTKLLCVTTAYFITHKRRNGVIYQPTDSDAGDFVADEINTAMRDVSVFGAALLSDPEKLSRYNKTDKKVFQGATLDIKGGKSARAFRRLTKDFVIYDELDGFDRDIDGEGTPLSLGDVRVQTSSFPKSIRGSTPGLEGMSMMEDEFRLSDMKFYRHLPCPHCGHKQILSFKKGFKFHDHDYRTAHFECLECKEKIGYEQYAHMDRNGRWETHDGHWIDDDSGMFYNPEGERIAPPKSVGFWIWAAYSYYKVWTDIAHDFLRANEARKQGDPTKMKSFTNTVLAETYGETKVEADKERLKVHREPYPVEVPAGVIHVTAGVDVQDDRFEIEVCGWGVQEESWSIHYTSLYGNLDRAEIWTKLAEYLNRTLDGVDGTKHAIKLVCIDSGGHYTSEVYKFCAKKPDQWIPVKGHAEAGKPIATFPKEVHRDHKVRLTMVGTDTAKELIYARYKITDVGPGYCHYPIPGNPGPHEKDEYYDAYFEMATAEHYVKQHDRKGHEVRVWKKIASRRNEALDCRVYNTAAIRIGQQHYGLRLEDAAAPAPPVDPAPDRKDDKPDTPVKKRRAARSRKSTGFTQGWRK